MVLILQACFSELLPFARVQWMFLYDFYFSIEFFPCAEVSVLYCREMSEFAQGLSALDVYASSLSDNQG